MTSDSQSPTTESIVRNALVPIGASILFVAAVVTWLGWWGLVLRYRAPARRWVRWVPVSMLLAALVGLNYGHLSDQSAVLVACLLLLGVFVGVGEELMLRGTGVHVFKRAGFSKGKVALWSSVVFGLPHISNAIGQGTQARRPRPPSAWSCSSCCRSASSSCCSPAAAASSRPQPEQTGTQPPGPVAVGLPRPFGKKAGWFVPGRTSYERTVPPTLK